jgi:hypothetical protein
LTFKAGVKLIPRGKQLSLWAFSLSPSGHTTFMGSLDRDGQFLNSFNRIQQIQILLAANTSHEHKQKVWSQIEASMHLQGSILQNSISDENFLYKISSSIFGQICGQKHLLTKQK